MPTSEVSSANEKLKIILGEGNYDHKREHAYQWSRVAHPEWITGNGGWVKTFVQTFAGVENAFEEFIIFDNRTQAIFLQDFYAANPDWGDAPVEWVITFLSNNGGSIKGLTY